MKFLPFLFPCLLLSAAAEPTALPEVELVPPARLGHRGYVKVEEIEWKGDHPKLGKTTVVHKLSDADEDRAPLIALAKEYGMTRRTEWENIHPEFGAPGDDITYCLNKELPGAVWINSTNHYRYFQIQPSINTFPRDENQDPILKGMPSYAEAVELCRGWMKTLGIDESRLARDPEGIAGFSVQTTTKRVTKWNKKAGKDIAYPIEINISFAASIGGLPAFWNGLGGRYHFNFIDEGELRRAEWCVRPSEPLGEFPLLGREELTEAILEGFCWVRAALDVERIEITRVELEAYHGRPNEPQQHFAPVWKLLAQPAGETTKGVWISIPALKQHRDKYNLQKIKPKPELTDHKPTVMTLEDIEQIKRNRAGVGAIIPPPDKIQE